ncbi:hypothetical protein T040910_035 [Synechococcus phage S-CAM3]|uniref:Uncharacterized protein n=1 Tax=Synechococcus phage S-CAM3 TaxID=1883366 RepID=A0A1D8KJE2_9CAUD|nr:hypothetical protein BOW87_gp223 [Synechococcus phage S-CAM3]AOV58540.1 hypothetical protein S250808_035 [Synechococcus phage S-CAM3]AOV58779.1 hypothetical protein T040910_035 [Synechococcus phage S-CAM3]AOV59018.1 hypothetical protein C421010_035 [Synechococcus phage S-CAM3]
MDNTEYQIYNLETFIGRYAALANKPLIFFRVYGWNNSTDVDAINASMTLYEDILPLDFTTLFKDSEYLVVEMESIIEAEQFLLDNFPQTQADVPKEQYIFYALYNDLGQVILSNE